MVSDENGEGVRVCIFLVGKLLKANKRWPVMKHKISR